MVKVKICGITNLEDAQASVKAGASALGFVFYRKSPRYITPQRASRIIKGLPKGIKKVGVFVDASEKRIKKIARFCRLDMLQFHGNESPEFCRKFKGYRVIKAFRIKNRLEREKILKYRTFAYLFDTFAKSKPGGTGKKFNWRLLKGIHRISKDTRRIRRPIFLSGGLNAGNVKAAIKIVRPAWVDVSSSVEARPGKKDLKKLKQFLGTVLNSNS